MAKLTQDMKDIVAKAKVFIVATASKDGKPNGVPVGLVRVISDDEIEVVDVAMHKTRQNIDENPIVAVTCWNLEVHYGYQFKGKARVETSGKLFDEAKQWLQERPGEFKFNANAAITVKVDEIYYVGAWKDSSINLAE